MAFMEEWLGKIPFSPKRIWQHDLGLQNFISANYKCPAWWFSLVLQPQYLGKLATTMNIEHWISPEYSSDKYEAICPATQVKIVSCNRTKILSTPDIWMDKVEKYKGVGMGKSKSRSQPHWDAVARAKRAVHKRMPLNINELKQCCKKDLGKIFPEADKLLPKRILQSWLLKVVVHVTEL